jgi:hypothetical protein
MKGSTGTVIGIGWVRRPSCVGIVYVHSTDASRLFLYCRSGIYFSFSLPFSSGGRRFPSDFGGGGCLVPPVGAGVGGGVTVRVSGCLRFSGGVGVPGPGPGLVPVFGFGGGCGGVTDRVSGCRRFFSGGVGVTAPGPGRVPVFGVDGGVTDRVSGCRRFSGGVGAFGVGATGAVGAITVRGEPGAPGLPPPPPCPGAFPPP